MFSYATPTSLHRAVASLARHEHERQLGRVYSVEEARRRARRKLPPVLFDFVDGGADDEVSMRENRRAFSLVGFRPSIAMESAQPDLTTSVLGATVALPVVLAPCGAVRLVHADGDREVAQAAATAGAAFVLSVASATSLEEVAAVAAGPAWFQLYPDGDEATNEQLLRHAHTAGYRALFVTVDAPVQGNRERDKRHGVRLPLAPSAHNAFRFAPQLLRHPRWTIGYLRDGMPTSFGSVPPLAPRARSGSPGSTWTGISWARRLWNGPLVVKGVLAPDDARRAVDHGADAIVVSNHGGRQLDGTPAPLAVLPAVREAVGKDAQILVDGGVRRGGDAVKAIALGADAVMIGRPYLYGLAVGGKAGVERILEILRADMARTLSLLGCPSVGELGAAFVDAGRLTT